MGDIAETEPDVGDLTARGLCGVMAASLTATGVPAPIAAILAERACVPAVGAIADARDATIAKGKRKVSKYARTFGREYKALKRKHPRTSHKELTKKAHRAAKAAAKGQK